MSEDAKKQDSNRKKIKEIKNIDTPKPRIVKGDINKEKDSVDSIPQPRIIKYGEKNKDNNE